MSRFEARAHLRVRPGQLEGFKRQAAEMMRVTREKDTGTLAYDWLDRHLRPEARVLAVLSPTAGALPGTQTVDWE